RRALAPSEVLLAELGVTSLGRDALASRELRRVRAHDAGRDGRVESITGEDDRGPRRELQALPASGDDPAKLLAPLADRLPRRALVPGAHARDEAGEARSHHAAEL